MVDRQALCSQGPSKKVKKEERSGWRFAVYLKLEKRKEKEANRKPLRKCIS